MERVELESEGFINNDTSYLRRCGESGPVKWRGVWCREVKRRFNFRAP